MKNSGSLPLMSALAVAEVIAARAQDGRGDHGCEQINPGQWVATGGDGLALFEGGTQEGFEGVPLADQLDGVAQGGQLSSAQKGRRFLQEREIDHGVAVQSADAGLSIEFEIDDFHG
jgi:hypothetical protein